MRSIRKCKVQFCDGTKSAAVSKDWYFEWSGDVHLCRALSSLAERDELTARALCVGGVHVLQAALVSGVQCRCGGTTPRLPERGRSGVDISNTVATRDLVIKVGGDGVPVVSPLGEDASEEVAAAAGEEV